MFHISIFLSCLLLSDAFILPFRQDVTPPTNPEEFSQRLMRFMTFVMPLKSVTMAFRSMNKMIGLNAFMQVISFLESLVNMLTNRMDGMGASVVSKMMSKMMGMPQDICLQRLICDLTIRNRRRRRNKRDLTKTTQVKKPQGNAAEQRITIKLKFSGPNFSSMPSMPSMPSMSSIPSMSSMPSMPLMSSISSMSSVPSMPSVFKNSSSFTYSSSSLQDPCERMYGSCPYSTSDMFDALKKFFTVWREIRLPRNGGVPFFQNLEPLDIDQAFYF